jgi:hypothetical protein
LHRGMGMREPLTWTSRGSPTAKSPSGSRACAHVSRSMS